MARVSVGSLTQAERALVDETSRKAMRELDEDGLVALHARVRRARDKYVQLHRREVASRVEVAGGRGVVAAAPRRSAGKAEVFEDALARVSKALAAAARASAKALKEERLAAAAGDAEGAGVAAKGKGKKGKKGKGKKGDAASTRARAVPPVEKKTRASSKAAGARRQAARDAR